MARRYSLNKSIARYRKQGRGKGKGEMYRPWLRVERSGLPSVGKSTILYFKGRQLHFLSRGEVLCFLLATMMKDFLEAREQFPLSLESSEHEVTVYTESSPDKFYPGTRQIAESLGIKHPADPWVMTTDLLISISLGSVVQLIAVSYKPKLPISKRKLDLLRIEKAYWESRGVEWLFITADLIGRSFSNLLLNFRIFALDESVELNHELMRDMMSRINAVAETYSQFIQHYVNLGYKSQIAKKAFWSGYWYGWIPLKVIGRFDPCAPLETMTTAEFLQLNPILNRRTSWI